MARILLGVTGSVAAIRTPKVFHALREAGHDVRVVPTKTALYFFEPTDLEATINFEGDPFPPGPVIADKDEWPAIGYLPGDPVLHIELRRWADLMVVAPLDANTLAKFALGLADNCLTCVFRAWDFSKPVILAPAMNTFMWESPVTRRHLSLLLADHGDGWNLDRWPLSEATDIFAQHAPGIVLVPPQAKRLACGDFGMGAMAEVASIAEAVRQIFESDHDISGHVKSSDS